MNLGELIAQVGLNTTPLLEGLKQAENSVQSSSNKMKMSFQGISTKLEQVGKKLKGLGTKMSMAVTLPLVGFATGAIKLSKDFEASMSKITGLVGVAADQVNAWKGQVLQLAPQLGKSAKELGDALFFITSAGIKGSKAIDVLKASGKASVSGLGDTAVIADLVTSAMNAYGSATLSATKATDVLVAAVREGKAEASELAGSMGKVLPFSSELGVSFNEVGAAMAAMTRTGTNAAEAATSLRSIFSSFIKPSKQAEDALKAMGTSSADFRKTLKEKGLLQALIDLKDLQKEYGDETLGVVIPNIRALSGVLDLMGANVEDNKKVFQNMQDVTGSLGRAFDAASKTGEFGWNTAVEKMKTATTTFGLELQKVVIPIINKLADKVGQAATWFSHLSDKSKRTLIVVAGAAAAIGPALVAIGLLTTALSGLASVFAFLSGPVGLVVAAVAVLAAAFNYAYQNWEAIKERISDWSWWQNTVIDMATFFLKYSPFSSDRVAAEALSSLKVKTKDYEHEMGSFADSIKDSAMQAIEALGLLKDFEFGSGAGTLAEEKKQPGQATLPTLTTKKSGLEDLIARRKEILKYDAALRSIPKGIPALDSALDKLGKVETWDDSTWEQFQAILQAFPKLIKDFQDQVDKSGEKVNAVTEKTLTWAKLGEDGIGAFATTLNSAFDAALINGENFFEVFGQGLINMIKKLAAAAAAALVLASILTLVTGGTSAALGLSGGFKGIFGGLFGGLSGMGMARGGIVPPGFPNDTYPALLSSNEMVIPQPIPLGSVGNPLARGSERLDVTVHGKLGMDSIYFSNERYSSKKSLIE